MDGTSISVVLGVIYGSLIRKLMEPKTRLDLLMESQLPKIDQGVDAWFKAVW
ncbi:hypothetical protein C1H46_007402 [Malus baccata]|uniref:Uncharacterized protein n=1 Tax=Malus baccata TaxID=106549 RepID=A0A540N7I4_MALBA|nr:hypothetical protein C1H46_007402 [Malus baccata]